ncbi:uncharacterized protein [Eurosta solidaginis]|uniref:uncharacterized protein isoform X2 n=1 Tax=Eurosta solidaginis TaxID=178769 RepID=UPI0035316D10
MSSGEIKESRKRWTREETLLLLQYYSARKDEFKHSRKKKYAYVNVLKDMFARGFLDTTVKIKALEAKMRTLLIASTITFRCCMTVIFITSIEVCFTTR